MCFCYHLEDCKSVWAKPAMDGGQEPISSSDTLVPHLSENEQGVVQDGSESLSNHGCQGVLKDTEGGIFSIELIIDPEPTNFIPKRIFADKEGVHFYSFWCTVIDAMLHLCTFECFTLSM
jgi:hypothetical protein